MGFAYACQVWTACNTSCDYTQPTQHHKKKHQHHDLPQSLASGGFNFIGECNRHMLHDWSQSTQHGNVILIDETNIFFYFIDIILQVLDQRAHELKVSYFSAYFLYFLAVASKQHALTVSIHQYFNCRCPPSPCHVLAWFLARGHGAIVTMLLCTHRYHGRYDCALLLV